MSTVLWANLLHEGKVVADERDKPAPCRHRKKLDKLTRQLGLRNFLSFQDYTDLQFNLSADELPPGIESTDELMAQQRTWMAAQDAVETFANPMGHIDQNHIRFGFFSDDRDEILRDPRESLGFAERSNSVAEMFNFSVVM